ncbi:MAG: hypothetical protein ABJB66_07200 [Gemmatimonadaceae bacterium]
MMKTLIAMSIFVTGMLATSASAQKTIPIRALTPPAESPEHFKSTPSVRQLPNGRAIVHDILGKRVMVFDTTMKSFTVSADSAGESGTKYPAAMFSFYNPLIPYLGDSTLFTDFDAKTFIVIGPDGKLGHAMSHAKATDLMSPSQPSNGVQGTDLQGRLIYREIGGFRPPPLKPGEATVVSTRDTIKLVRADFNTRTIDTVASYTANKSIQTVFTLLPGGKTGGTRIVNPIPPASDSWAVMSDGTIAVVRAHDYHIDFTYPDGSTFSSAKLPFDWRRLTDDDKKARIDSMQRVIDSVTASGRPFGMIIGFSKTGEGAPSKPDTIIPKISFVPLNEISDYVPPIALGAAKPDADNNLWILPTTSTQAKGGLLYDVVNRKGELVERVQLPKDRVVAGFGKGGVVYLAKFDAASKLWTLERCRINRSQLKQ